MWPINQCPRYLPTNLKTAPCKDLYTNVYSSFFLPWEEKKEWNLCPTFCFHGSARETCFCLTWLKMLMGTTCYAFMMATENTAELYSLLEHQETYSTTERHQRWQEIANSWKWNPYISLMEKSHAQAQGRSSSENVESVVRFIGKGFPLYIANQ